MVSIHKVPVNVLQISVKYVLYFGSSVLPLEVNPFVTRLCFNILCFRKTTQDRKTRVRRIGNKIVRRYALRYRRIEDRGKW